jgi:hypothetical protein
MTAPKREQFKNNSTSTLNGAINNSVTTITVADGSQFPADGNFRIIVETELMLVTARSTNDLTVVRGIEGSTPASHSDSAVVTHIVTDASFNRLVRDSVVLGGDDSPAPPLNTLVSADSITPLTSADFTQTNFGGVASVLDQAGTILLRAPGDAGDNHRILTVAAPSAPWTLIAALQVFAMTEDAGSSQNHGIVLRESSTGKLYSLALNRNSTAPQRFALDRWTNETTFSGNAWRNTNPIFHSDVLWLKVEDNNTNLLFSLSDDGVNWVQVFSESRTQFMFTAPNQCGITSNNRGSAAKDALIRLVHFHTEG